jgi:hypothetical protein
MPKVQQLLTHGGLFFICPVAVTDCPCEAACGAPPADMQAAIDLDRV